MARILVTDGMDKQKAEELRNLGYEVVEEPVEAKDLPERIKAFDCVIVRSRTKITKEVIDSALLSGKLKMIVRGGVGLDNIDVAYAKENGIDVYNTPNANSNSVAELVIAQMINISRFVHISNVEMRKGIWGKNDYKGQEIAGKTLGLIGFGRISRLVANKAKALGMNVIFNDIHLNQDAEYEYASLEEIFKRSDYLSLHIPGGERNHHLISQKEFEMMKDGIYFLDMARGGIVDEEALLDAIESGKVKAAALDVFEEEPVTNRRLLSCPKISFTPHIGAATVEAQKRVGAEVVEIIKENLND